MADARDPNSFASRVRDHWVRKQEIKSKLPQPQAHNIMIEPLLATELELLKKEQSHLTRNIEQELPGNAGSYSPGRTPERKELAKKKSQYYDDAFAVRESNTSARERVHRESMVMVEVRTNVIVRPQAYYLASYSLMESRLATNTPSSLTSPTISQAATNGQSPQFW
jgi:hypothetical protein